RDGKGNQVRPLGSGGGSSRQSGGRENDQARQGTLQDRGHYFQVRSLDRLKGGSVNDGAESRAARGDPVSGEKLDVGIDYQLVGGCRMMLLSRMKPSIEIVCRW